MMGHDEWDGWSHDISSQETESNINTPLSFSLLFHQVPLTLRVDLPTPINLS